jgi:hypothetical protein
LNLLVAALLRRKRPKRCREIVLDMRMALLSAPSVANDADGLTAAERAQALVSLGRLCMTCSRDCRLAGARSAVPMRAKAKAI